MAQVSALEGMCPCGIVELTFYFLAPYTPIYHPFPSKYVGPELRLCNNYREATPSTSVRFQRKKARQQQRFVNEQI